MDFVRYENEDFEDLLYRIGSQKEEIGTWQNVSDIMNDLLDLNHAESTYRKKYNKIKNKLVQKNNNNSKPITYKSKLDTEFEKLQKEKAKIQTEKLELARWRREDARDELIIEKIQESIENLPELIIPNRLDNTMGPKSYKEYLLAFGDQHYGKDLEIKGLKGEILNKYSPEKCEERMWRLLDRVQKIVKKENIEILHVWDFGDEIDGMLRVSQLMTLRYGAVDSAINFAEILANWLNELTKMVKVKFQMCKNSNHCELRELGQPKGSFKQDNLGKVILMFVKERLKNNPNFEIIENPTGFLYDNICGYNVLGFHGEAKNMANALKEYSMIYGTQINYLIGAHIHHNKSEEIGFDTECINIPSIIGVDDYSMSIRHSSNPGAKLLVFENNDGLSIDYRIRL